ncbi:MAG: ABC transporter ATP-binding protein [Ruminococcus sp.]|nr:ABC transporter ATP-binding protein [Ruminococcus sp.]
MEILKTEALTKVYGKGQNKVTALDQAYFSVEQGEFAAIVGTSGSGKSTLLHMLGGLDRPTSGKVFVEGKDIFSLKDEALTIFRRRKIGFVFQSFNLVPTLNVYENIVFPIQLDDNAVDEKFVGEVINALGIENMQERLPNQLSGGQQQRVAIARALAAKPAIILADEPTGNLDSKTSQDVLSLLKVTGQKFSQTIVMITHNEAIAQMADRIIRIEDGHIIKGGRPDPSLDSAESDGILTSDMRRLTK